MRLISLFALILLGVAPAFGEDASSITTETSVRCQTEKAYEVTVDYDVPVEAKIKKDWTELANASKGFKWAGKTGKSKVLISLIKCDGYISSEKLWEEFHRLGVEGVNLEEFLALGTKVMTKKSHIPKDFVDVVNFGDGLKFPNGEVIYLDFYEGEGGKRMLGPTALSPNQGQWSPASLFAGVNRNK